MSDSSNPSNPQDDNHPVTRSRSRANTPAQTPYSTPPALLPSELPKEDTSSADPVDVSSATAHITIQQSAAPGELVIPYTPSLINLQSHDLSADPQVDICRTHIQFHIN